MSAPKECRCPLARHTHGTRSCYSVCGCRCLRCRLVYSEATRRWRSGETVPRVTTDVTRVGTRRRIEALHWNGWSGQEIGDRLGLTFSAVFQMRTRQQKTTPATAERVAALFEELWDVQSTGPHAVRIRNWARRSGFAPPMAWDDDEIDDPSAVPKFGAPTGPREPAACGTRAAVRRHYRHGEPLDQACAAAQRREQAERRAKRGAA